jgi:hypothetical protein
MGGQENGCKERNKAGIKASEGNGVGGPHPSAGVIWGMARQGTTFDTPDLSNLGETVFDRQLPSRPATFLNLAYQLMIVKYRVNKVFPSCMAARDLPQRAMV